MVQTESVRLRTLEKKRQILQAASRVFRRSGLHGAGMREIAAEAGMRAGNLYYYFENKQDLLAFCQRDSLDGLLELGRRVEASDLSADQQLYLLILGHVQRVNEATPGSLAHLEVEALEPRWRDEILPQRDLYEGMVRHLVEGGIEAGIFRGVDARTAARSILGAVNWTVKWYRPDGDRSAGAIGRDIAEHLVRGLLADGVPFRAPDADLAVGGEPEPLMTVGSDSSHAE